MKRYDDMEEKHASSLPRKVLFLNAYSYPENISYSYIENGLYKSMANAGIQVDVITPTPTRNLSADDYEKYKKIRHELLYDGVVRIHRFRLFREGKSPIVRALRYLIGNVKSYFASVKYNDANLIFSNSTPPPKGYFALW